MKQPNKKPPAPRTERENPSGLKRPHKKKIGIKLRREFPLCEKAGGKKNRGEEKGWGKVSD